MSTYELYENAKQAVWELYKADDNPARKRELLFALKENINGLIKQSGAKPETS